MIRRLSYTSVLRQYVQPVPKLTDNVIVAMSSGVDSSVAASLYKHYPNVKGIYMANWDETAGCNEEEWKVVKNVCRLLNIPSERVSFEKEYWQQVFVPMINGYEVGITPNPDLNCNKFIKFGSLVEYLNGKYDGNYWLVTGHYSRVLQNTTTKEFNLFRSSYMPKDQSYYLSAIDKSTISRVLLPIGHMTKPQVRDIASDLNLINKDKQDSMGLCFVSQDTKKFHEFLDEYIQPNPGDIVDEEGKVWGKHEGLWYGTIGQRARVSMPQGDPKYKGQWFISDKNVDKNQLIIVKGTNHPKLFKNYLKVKDFKWLSDYDKQEELTLQYRSLQTPITIEWLKQDPDGICIKIYDKQRAMAPGQNVVVYSDERVLGSGIIEDARNIDL